MSLNQWVFMLVATYLLLSLCLCLAMVFFSVFFQQDTALAHTVENSLWVLQNICIAWVIRWLWKLLSSAIWYFVVLLESYQCFGGTYCHHLCPKGESRRIPWNVGNSLQNFLMAYHRSWSSSQPPLWLTWITMTLLFSRSECVWYLSLEKPEMEYWQK
jgi:hypothetical protein